MKKIILLTGAYGFVGSNLANYLKSEYIIWGLDIQEFKVGLYDKFFSWSDFDSIPFDEVDTIIHLAGKAHDTKGLSQANEYFEINTGLTQKIYDRFLSSGGTKFIFFSSVKAAADTVEEGYLTEEIVPKPKGAYGESKIKAEDYILSQDEGSKKYYILRPCMIHGPGNKGNLNLLYTFIQKGIPYPLGAFDNKRSFTSVDNLCYIIEKMISIDVDKGIYNIADDLPLSTNELIRIICKGLGQKTKIWNFPVSLIKLGAKLGDVLRLPLNTFRLNKLTENYLVSNEKIKRAIGVDKLPVSSTQGLEKTIKSFKE